MTNTLINFCDKYGYEYEVVNEIQTQIDIEKVFEYKEEPNYEHKDMIYFSYLISFYTEKKDEQRLYKCIQKFLSFNTPEAYYYLGLFYDRIKNDINKAIENYLFATEKGHIRSYYDLIRLSLINKEVNNAIKYCNILIMKGDNEGYYYLGRIYKKQSDEISAIKYFDEYVKHKTYYREEVLEMMIDYYEIKGNINKVFKYSAQLDDKKYLNEYLKKYGKLADFLNFLEFINKENLKIFCKKYISLLFTIIHDHV